MLVFSVPKNEIKYFDSDTVSVISNLAKRPSSFEIETIKGMHIDDFNASHAIKYLLHEIRQEKPSFLPQIREKDLESVVCVKPLLDNPRIIRQTGAFFLFGIAREKAHCAKVPKEYRQASDDDRPLLVNGNDKKRILAQLDKLGITRGSLFPEVDSVATYIRELYAERQEWQGSKPSAE